jgi:hypothetical protein
LQIKRYSFQAHIQARILEPIKTPDQPIIQESFRVAARDALAGGRAGTCLGDPRGLQAPRSFLPPIDAYTAKDIDPLKVIAKAMRALAELIRAITPYQGPER